MNSHSHCSTEPSEGSSTHMRTASQESTGTVSQVFKVSCLPLQTPARSCPMHTFGLCMHQSPLHNLSSANTCSHMPTAYLCSLQVFVLTEPTAPMCPQQATGITCPLSLSCLTVQPATYHICKHLQAHAHCIPGFSGIWIHITNAHRPLKGN